MIKFLQKYIDKLCSFGYYEIHGKEALIKFMEKKIKEGIYYQGNKNINKIKQLLIVQNAEVTYAYEHRIIHNGKETNALILCGDNWQPVYCGKKIIIK